MNVKVRKMWHIREEGSHWMISGVFKHLLIAFVASEWMPVSCSREMRMWVNSWNIQQPLLMTIDDMRSWFICKATPRSYVRSVWVFLWELAVCPTEPWDMICDPHSKHLRISVHNWIHTFPVHKIKIGVTDILFHGVIAHSMLTPVWVDSRQERGSKLVIANQDMQRLSQIGRMTTQRRAWTVAHPSVVEKS